MCVFYHQFHTILQMLLFRLGRDAVLCFLDKIQAAETAQRTAHIAHCSIGVALGSSAHKFIFDFRNFVLPLPFLSRLRAFSIPKWSRRVSPFAVIMQ